MRLHEEFAFFKREEISDGMGNFEGKWVEQFKTRAGIKYNTNRSNYEAIEAARLSGKKPAFLTIRNFQEAAKITPSWCCCDARNTTFNTETNQFIGEVYNISAIYLDPFNRQYFKLTLESGVAIG